MNDILAHDLNELEDRLLALVTIVHRAKSGSPTELRRLKANILGGNHCNSFLYLDVTQSIHNAINDAVCGMDHQKVS